MTNSQTRRKPEEASSSKRQRLERKRRKPPGLKRNAWHERRMRSGSYQQELLLQESTRARVLREEQNSPQRNHHIGTASYPSHPKSKPRQCPPAMPKANRRRCHHPQTPRQSRQPSRLPAASRTGSSRDFTSPGRNPSQATMLAVGQSRLLMPAVARHQAGSWADTGSSACIRTAREA